VCVSTADNHLRFLGYEGPLMSFLPPSQNDQIPSVLPDTLPSVDTLPSDLICCGPNVSNEALLPQRLACTDDFIERRSGLTAVAGVEPLKTAHLLLKMIRRCIVVAT
jgi:hypothetical protein